MYCICSPILPNPTFAQWIDNFFFIIHIVLKLPTLLQSTWSLLDLCHQSGDYLTSDHLHGLSLISYHQPDPPHSGCHLPVVARVEHDQIGTAQSCVDQPSTALQGWLGQLRFLQFCRCRTIYMKIPWVLGNSKLQRWWMDVENVRWHPQCEQKGECSQLVIRYGMAEDCIS